jgi:aminopeptidase N
MTTPTASAARDVLTQSEAEARVARISDVAYTLALDLRRGAPTYRGDVTVRFADSGSGDTFLDFKGKTIERFELNGQTLEPRWDGYHLTLPGDALAPRNEARIVYENDYDHTGDGFHQFIDPEDGEEYLYTFFEPYYGHRLFPCFDQPDIKATYALTITAPREWTVLANSRATESTPADEGRTRHVFEVLPRFSTYLLCIVAGPYEDFRDEHRGLPLGLFCRKSLAKYLDADELFTVTKQGLDFFGEFFDFPYPFTKYDQVFVPEFNLGAMENIGLVTHYEKMIFRDPPTENQRMGRAEVVLHEMAHMWYGDLVTMKWWNDLWLNESFASYMAYLAMVEATRFKTAWKEFNTGMKVWAYRQDQLVTTHPIAGTVADTDETFLNFDGITYGKGASVLKQLVATIGLGAFRAGMRRYFKRYAWGNATLAQFLEALEEGTGRDLKAWARLWLETASLNTLATRPETDGERLTSLGLTQSAPPAFDTLRPHHIEVALGREVGEGDGFGVAGGIVIDVLPAEIDGAEAEVAGVAGRPAPDFVFPNANDLTYAKVALDPRSLDFLRAKLDRIEDALLRQLVWSSLWSMVRDQQLSSIEFLALAREKLTVEPDLELVDATLKYVGVALDAYVPEERRAAEYRAWFRACWETLQRAPRGDAQIIWARALIGAAEAPDDLAHVGKLAEGEIEVEGLSVDQEMRWRIAARFIAHGMAGADARLAAERERDPSDRGQREALRAEVSRPDAATKAAAWERILGEGYDSFKLTESAMSGFNWSVQRDLLAPYVDRFFAAATEVAETRPNEFVQSYIGLLFPSYRVEPELLERSERLLAETPERLTVLVRLLKEQNDDLARAIACRRFAAMMVASP